ncbi:TatD-related DNase [Ceraceosorus bombacis]|uniref:TatD-related DNase n=1 Tax=Ceraceosorus bombacis TaxID=401625 RepID=A0A0N7LB74_9BASI|nr:TatD-related DNase [Ceraceosorus bombacis]
MLNPKRVAAAASAEEEQRQQQAAAQDSLKRQLANLRFIDIGVNLTDGMYSGCYHGHKSHSPDLDSVLGRARKAGVIAQIVTGGSLSESRHALDLAEKHQDLYSTAGCHPTRASEFSKYHKGGPDGYLAALTQLLEAHSAPQDTPQPSKKIVAIGECGLDYDRLHFTGAEEQRKRFAMQLDLQKRFGLPLFLHSRAAHDDFMAIIKPHLEYMRQSRFADKASNKQRWGVVHSFTGSAQEAQDYLDAGFFLSINGCGMKTQENLDALKAVPLERLLLETDAPWCEPRATHASAKHIDAFKKRHPDLAELYYPASAKKEKWDAAKAVKSRNEPCGIGGIAAVVAAVLGKTLEEVVHAAEQNSRWLFRI